MRNPSLKLIVALSLPIFLPIAYAQEVPEAIDKVTDMILSWQGMTAMLAIVLETIFRLVPSEKPLSIAWLVARSFHSLGKLFTTAANWLDSVLPQKRK